MPKKWFLHLVLWIASFMHAMNYVFGKALFETYQMSPYLLLILRMIIAGALFWAFHAIYVKEKVKGNDLRRLFICSIFGTSLNIICFYIGLDKLDSTINVSLLNTSIPIMVFIISAFYLKEAMTKIKLLGLALGITGVMVLLKDDISQFDASNLAANGFIMLNAIFYATYLVITKPLLAKYNPLTVFKWMITFGFLISFPFCFHSLDTIAIILDPPVLLLTLGVGVLSTFVTFGLNAWTLKHANASLVGMYIYTQPLVVATFGVLLRGEVITINTTITAVLIFLGVYLVGKQH